MRKLLNIALLSFIIGGLVLASPTLADSWEYRIELNAKDNSGSSRTYEPVLTGISGENLVDYGYIKSTGLDSRVIEGVTNFPHMVADDEIAFVIPDFDAYSVSTPSFYTGYSPDNSDMEIVIGNDGYVETTDISSMEIGGNTFDLEYDTYINVDRQGTIVYKEDSFVCYSEADGSNITASQLSEADDIDPTGYSDLDSVWSNEANAYDNNAVTAATSSGATVGNWSSYLILTIGACNVESIKFDIDSAGATDEVDIGIYDGTYWYDVYEGTFTDDTTVEKYVQEGVICGATQVRLRLKNGTSDNGAEIDEVDFVVIDEDLSVTATGVSAGAQKINLTSNGTIWGVYLDDNLEDSEGLSASQITANTVLQSSNISVVTNRPQRNNSFYAQGLFWLFYCDSTYLCYRTSANGSSWSAENQILFGYQNEPIAVATDGTNVHYVVATATTLKYRHGVLSDDGSISWTSGEVTALTVSGAITEICLILDSGGYPCVGYCDDSGTDYMEAIRSSTKDGTWNEDIDFTTQFVTSHESIELAPLSNGDVVAVLGDSGTVLTAYLYDSSDDEWDTVEIVSTSLLEQDWQFTVCADENDDVHVVFIESTNEDITYVVRDFDTGSWSSGSEVEVDSSIEATASIDMTYNDTSNELHIFWADETADKVYTMDYNISTTTWDVSPTEFVDESVATIASNQRINAVVNESNNRVLFSYITNAATDNLRVTGYIPGALNVPDTANNWIFMRGDAFPYCEYIKHEVAGVPIVHYQPVTIIESDILVDREGAAQNGTITWGTNEDLTLTIGDTIANVDVVPYGTGDTGAQDTVPTVGLPDNWYADGSNVANLPMYDNFYEVATDLGMSAKTLYMWAGYGIAAAIGLSVLIFTGSGAIALVLILLVLNVFSAATVISGWTVVMIALFGGSILLLAKRV